MTVKCDGCGVEHGAISTATIVDESGGSIVHLCRVCRETVKAPRCRVCGSTRDAQRAEGILFHCDGTADEPPESYRLCDECRRDLITGRGVPYA